MHMEGKRVVITGAAGALGSATMKKLVEKGAKVVGIDKVSGPGSLDIRELDLTHEDAIQDGIESAIADLGGLDILINNAGLLSIEEACGVPRGPSFPAIKVNFLAPWRVTAAALPHLLRSENGPKVVNVASLFAVVNAPFIPAYCASKRALSAYSDVLRMEQRGKLSVTTVYPGFIDTPIHNEAVRQGVCVKTLVSFMAFGKQIVSLEEKLPAAANGLVRACENNYRNVGTTAMGTLTLWLASHAPQIVDWFIANRINWLTNRGRLQIKLDPVPSTLPIH